MTLPRRDVVRIFFRSFLIQGLWTAQRGQNLGYVFSLWPVFRRLYPKREDRARAGRAHAGFFSTHPYTAGVLLGVVAGLEEEHALGRKEGRDQVLSARSAMSGPLAALGEIFFWGTWLPFCLAAALFMRALRPEGTGAPLLFLGLFNGVHMVVRGAGLVAGYRWKTDVVPRLATIRIQSLIPVVSAAAMGVVALSLLLAPVEGVSMARSFLWVGAFWGLLRMGVRPSVVAVATAVVGVVVAWGRTLS